VSKIAKPGEGHSICMREGCYENLTDHEGPGRPPKYCSQKCANADRASRRRSVSKLTRNIRDAKAPCHVRLVPPRSPDSPFNGRRKGPKVPMPGATCTDPSAWDDYLKGLGLAANQGMFLPDAEAGKGLTLHINEAIAVAPDRTDEFLMIKRGPAEYVDFLRERRWRYVKRNEEDE